MTETVLDARGLLCPLPVLKTRKALKGLPRGGLLVVETTDPAADIDMPHFCNESGNELVGREQEGDVTRFRIRKA